MLTRAQAWAWYFARNPRVAAVWGHQNGRWPMHSGNIPEDAVMPRECYQCNSRDCWCHLETGEGSEQDAGERDEPGGGGRSAA